MKTTKILAVMMLLVASSKASTAQFDDQLSTLTSFLSTKAGVNEVLNLQGYTQSGERCVVMIANNSAISSVFPSASKSAQQVQVTIQTASQKVTQFKLTRESQVKSFDRTVSAGAAFLNAKVSNSTGIGGFRMDQEIRISKSVGPHKSFQVAVKFDKLVLSCGINL